MAVCGGMEAHSPLCALNCIVPGSSNAFKTRSGSTWSEQCRSRERLPRGSAAFSAPRDGGQHAWGLTAAAGARQPLSGPRRWLQVRRAAACSARADVCRRPYLRGGQAALRAALPKDLPLPLPLNRRRQHERQRDRRARAGVGAAVRLDRCRRARRPRGGAALPGQRSGQGAPEGGRAGAPPPAESPLLDRSPFPACCSCQRDGVGAFTPAAPSHPQTPRGKLFTATPHLSCAAPACTPRPARDTHQAPPPKHPHQAPPPKTRPTPTPTPPSAGLLRARPRRRLGRRPDRARGPRCAAGGGGQRRAPRGARAARLVRRAGAGVRAAAEPSGGR